jgi:hypothetical protein
MRLIIAEMTGVRRLIRAGIAPTARDAGGRNPGACGTTQSGQLSDAADAISQPSPEIVLRLRSRIVQRDGIARLWRANQNKNANSYIIEIAV